MDSISALVGFLAALSVATERVTEIIKGLPVLSAWLGKEQDSATSEQLRKAVIHVIAVLVGTLFAWLVKDQLPANFPIKITDFPTALVFGAITSGGSAMWNSVLDITREINQQKQLLTAQLAAGQKQLPATPPASGQLVQSKPAGAV